jgi:hypothetical protein
VNANPPIAHFISTAWAAILPGVVSVLTNTLRMGVLLQNCPLSIGFSDWKRREGRNYEHDVFCNPEGYHNMFDF